MESSRRGLLDYMAEHSSILKNNENKISIWVIQAQNKNSP